MKVTVRIQGLGSRIGDARINRLVEQAKRLVPLPAEVAPTPTPPNSQTPR